MSAVPDQGGPTRPPLPLGQLLIERGFLSEDQLASALAQQARTGSPLGELLVELGYVPAALIAQALATQHGGLLKTEYGFATGFTDTSAVATAAPPPHSAPAARAPQPRPPAEHAAAPLRIVDATPRPVAGADDTTERLAAMQRELEQLRARTGELQRDRNAAVQRAGELERVREDLEAQLVEMRKAEAELAERRRAEAEPDVDPPVTEHLAFVGSPAGYTLVRCPGPPPLVDTIVELPPESGIGGRHRVLRVADAKIPGVDSPCVYLLSVG